MPLPWNPAVGVSLHHLGDSAHEGNTRQLGQLTDLHLKSGGLFENGSLVRLRNWTGYPRDHR